MLSNSQYFISHKLKLLQEKFNNGLDLELDEDYYKAAVKRFEIETAQETLF